MASILWISVKMNDMAKRPSLYAQAGVVFLTFFAGTSGFAVQYLAWLTPWVAELGVLPVAWYVFTGSVFLLVVYNYWNLGMPWYLAIAYPWGSHQYFQLLCWISVLILAYAAWRRMSGREPLRTAAFSRISAHMRRDAFPVTPTYAGDDVLYEQADEYHNLATELADHGRRTEADAVQNQSIRMAASGQRMSAELARLQPARLNARTPEESVDASLEDYNRGDFGQCVYDATQSLKLRPGMPSAWNNIALCNGSEAESRLGHGAKRSCGTFREVDSQQAFRAHLALASGLHIEWRATPKTGPVRDDTIPPSKPRIVCLPLKIRQLPLCFSFSPHRAWQFAGPF